MALVRTLEPEVMDSPESAATYDDMDHGAVNRAFVDDLLAFTRVEGDTIDLGTGSARIPIELCRRDDEIRVIAIDQSIDMLDVARINIEIAGLIDRIMLVHADAKSSEFSKGQFSVVLSNSLIHHLPEPRLGFEEAIRLVNDEGRIFFRDLMRPDSQQAVEKTVDAYAGDESDHARQLFHNSLHAALNLDEIRHLVCELGFSAETVSASSDRHWTWAARMTDR